MFPHQRVIDDGDLAGLEEERRLFYVGITRAKDQLYLTCLLYTSFIAPADYTPGSHLTRLLSGRVTDIANGIVRRRDRALADSCISAPTFSK